MPGNVEKMYLLNEERWKDYVKVREFFLQYAKDHYGDVSEIRPVDGTMDAEFTIETDSIDFYKDSLKEFTEILPLIKSMSAKGNTGDTVTVTVRVGDVWRPLKDE